MHEDTKQMLIFVTAISFVVVTGCVLVYLYNVNITQSAFENGYSQQLLPGYRSPVWVKDVSTNSN